MHVLQNSNTAVSINEIGAEVKSLLHKGKELMYQKEEGFWQRSSPVLFPIVGRLIGDSFSYQGTKYSLNQHGFARDLPFDLIQSNENNCTFRLQDGEQTFNGYPFAFSLSITYRLSDTGLYVNYAVESKETSIYYSIGAHPAFQLMSDMDNYELRFDNDSNINPYGLMEGHAVMRSHALDLGNLTLSEESFDMDSLIFKHIKSNNLDVFKNGVRVFGMQFDAPYFGIWKQKNAPFICLEPWWGIPDSRGHQGVLTEKEGIILLDSHQKNTHSWAIIF